MTIDYGHYARLGVWASGEAACLLVGVEPGDWVKLLMAEYSSSEPEDIDFLCSYSREYYQQLQEQKALCLMRQENISRIQGLLKPILECLERDLLAGIIAPTATQNKTNYFAPCAFVTWAASKGFDIPSELAGLILPNLKAPSEPLQSSLEAAGVEGVGQSKQDNDIALSNLLNAPSRKDDWFDAINDMTINFFAEHGQIPNVIQAWGRLLTAAPAGYEITTIKDKDEECLQMPGVKALSKSAFSKRWKKYTTNKPQ